MASDTPVEAVDERPPERSWDTVIGAAGDESSRTWRLYVSGARLGFERGELDVAQLLLARPLPDGSPRPDRSGRGGDRAGGGRGPGSGRIHIGQLRT